MEENTVKYLMIFEVSIDKMLPSVGKVTDEINGFMAGFGFNEKLTVRSDLPLELTTCRLMTIEEETLMAETTIKEMKRLHPEWNPTLKSFNKIS